MLMSPWISFIIAEPCWNQLMCLEYTGFWFNKDFCFFTSQVKWGEITNISLIPGNSSRTGILAVIETYFGLKIIKGKKKNKNSYFSFLMKKNSNKNSDKCCMLPLNV